jgi:hypothetical protein
VKITSVGDNSEEEKEAEGFVDDTCQLEISWKEH